MGDDNHKYQKLIEALKANSINQDDPVPEWLYIKYTDVSGATGVTRCLCTTPIQKFYTIQNKHTLKNEIIGCECIKKFLENAVECEKCKKPLRNLTKRLDTGCLVCPECTRAEKAAEKLRVMNHPFANYKYYQKGHPYDGMKFHQIYYDFTHVEDLVNNPPYPTKSYECLMAFIAALCEIVE